MSVEEEIQIAEESDEEFTPLEYDVQSYPADYTLEVLYNKWKNNDIIIPKLQRRYVWKPQQASRLIESFLMGLPIPPIFFYVQSDQKYLVIDGLQRLQSVVMYFSGFFGEEDKLGKRKTFKLEGINPESRFYKKAFQELHPDDQRKLQNAVLRVIIIRQVNPKNDDTSIYHIFERLNTGGTILQDQEVRNCVYYGKLNDMLIRLNEYENWRKILGKPKEDPRQKDVQDILRYLALFHNGHNYKKPMKDFLSEYMSKNQNPDDKFIQDEEKRFKTTCDRIIAQLGERPLNPTGPLNLSKFDSVFIAFAKNQLSQPSNIKEKLVQLENNSDFLSLTSAATTDTEIVKKRLEFVNKFLFG
ncbi:MAG TPA: DUF262 domain-containing protein [Candidatus Nitrosotalea sp.]|nr:DUF262 domain-containing protein [Candidatus Nitrosotalea sp.]